jgi:hypothetical protein
MQGEPFDFVLRERLSVSWRVLARNDGGRNQYVERHE